MKTFITILLFLACNLAQAEMYKSLDENGEVVYSDKPPTLDAKEFKPPALTVRPPIKYVPKEKPAVEAKLPPYPYSDLQFSKPETEANFHDNEGNIAYALMITPVLNTKLGHYLTIKLDGTVVTAKTSSLSGTLNNVDRGSHNLNAEVCDANGKVLRSASLNFHVHKTALMKNQPVAPPPPTVTP